MGGKNREIEETSSYRCICVQILVCRIYFFFLLLHRRLLFSSLVKLQEYLSLIRNHESLNSFVCKVTLVALQFVFFVLIIIIIIIMTMINDRSRKPDRYHPILFSLFRTVTIRSKSLENIYDRNRRKEGKINNKATRDKYFSRYLNKSMSFNGY